MSFKYAYISLTYDDRDRINNTINNRLSCVDLAGSAIDLNDLNRSYHSGFYEIGQGVPNSPINEWGLLLVIAHVGAIQVIFKDEYIYMRMRTGTPVTWTSWRRIMLELF